MGGLSTFTQEMIANINYIVKNKSYIISTFHCDFDMKIHELYREYEIRVTLSHFTNPLCKGKYGVSDSRIITF